MHPIPGLFTQPTGKSHTQVDACVCGGERHPSPFPHGCQQSAARPASCWRSVVSPISWQRNLNLCGSPRSSSESRRPLDVISVCTRPGQHVTDRIGPYQPQVPGAEFGLGVRWRLALTSIGVPGPSLGNPPVVVFSLGLGGVPGEGPVAGQFSGTLAPV